MVRKPAPGTSRNTKLGEVKAVIAALAITFTLALWNLFSRPKEPVVTADVMETEAVAITEDPVAMLDLPPLPTLIPPLPESAMVIPMPQTGSGMQGISQPIVVPQGKILLGGSEPGAVQPRQANRKPAARTRSSQ